MLVSFSVGEFFQLKNWNKATIRLKWGKLCEVLSKWFLKSGGVSGGWFLLRGLGDLSIPGVCPFCHPATTDHQVCGFICSVWLKVKESQSLHQDRLFYTTLTRMRLEEMMVQSKAGGKRQIRSYIDTYKMKKNIKIHKTLICFTQRKKKTKKYIPNLRTEGHVSNWDWKERWVIKLSWQGYLCGSVG